MLALDLHAGQIQGYFNIPVDHLYATPVTVEYFRSLKAERKIETMTVVSPDTGGVERARVRLPRSWERRSRSSTSAAKTPTWWK